MTNLTRRSRPQQSIAAEAAFRAALDKMGATLSDGRWLGGNVPHQVQCAQGHACTAWPSNVRNGIGICRTCAGNDTRVAEAAFRARLEEAGVTLLEDRWLGSKRPHRVRCAQGHNITVYPARPGACRTCAGKDPQAAEAAFRSRLAELGATLLEPRWLGSDKPHRVRCAQGHNSTARPSNSARWRACRACAGKDPRAAEAAFRSRLAELGATLLEDRWLGTNKPHRVRCSQGHDCAPRPNHVQEGSGVCHACAGKSWDVLYVVSDELGETVKVGVTSGDHRPRLHNHRRDGLDQVVRLLPALPEGVARELERNVLAALKDAGERPARGREYFPGHVLPLMLDVIDHHPGVRLQQQSRPTS